MYLVFIGLFWLFSLISIYTHTYVYISGNCGNNNSFGVTDSKAFGQIAIIFSFCIFIIFLFIVFFFCALFLSALIGARKVQRQRDFSVEFLKLNRKLCTINYKLQLNCFDAVTFCFVFLYCWQWINAIKNVSVKSMLYNLYYALFYMNEIKGYWIANCGGKFVSILKSNSKICIYL